MEGVDFFNVANWAVQLMEMGGEASKNLQSGAPLLFDAEEYTVNTHLIPYRAI